MLRALYTRLQQKNRVLSFPFNFEGLPVDEEILKTRYIPMNQRCRQTMTKIFEEDIADGFKYAYKSMLRALEARDTAFLKNTCEPNLYVELKKGFDLLSEYDVQVRTNSIMDDLNLKYTSFSFIYGVHHNRRANLNKEKYEVTNLWNMRNGIDLQHFKPLVEADVPHPFIRVGCLLTCSNGVHLHCRDNEPVLNQTLPHYHKVIFEGLPNCQNTDEAVDAEDTRKDIWKVMSNLETEEKVQLIRKIFQVDSITWKIVDIDNFMNGNPYTR